MSPTMNPSAEAELRVLMLPWLAHGHISPALELAKRLTTKSKVKIVVHLCSTPVNIRSVEDHLDRKSFPCIELVELELPALPDLPPSLHTTKHLPPHLMDTLKEAFDASASSFELLLNNLHPDMLFYDFLQPWAPEVASRLDIPAVLFFPAGACEASYFTHHLLKPDQEFPFRTISLGSHEQDLAYCRDMFESKCPGISNGERLIRSLHRSSGFMAMKTFHIESKYMAYLASLIEKEIVPTGPLVQEGTHLTEKEEEEAKRFIEWLDRRESSSVIFVSFGSEYFMSEEEIEEMARGLELSDVAFIWVVRFPKSLKEDEEDPAVQRVAVLQERVGGKKGLVVQGWAPQQRILGHPSVGAILTHCGWSSVMEAMMLGLPLVALPAQLDQPFNAKLITKDLGIGVEVRREAGSIGKFKGEDVGNAIRRVLVEKEGDVIRKKAREMAETMVSRGDKDIAYLVDKMTALCGR